MRYVCIRNLIGVVFGFKGKPCRNSAFSNTFLLMLNIICFLLAVLNPCFVFCIWKLSLFLSKASLARDVLVGVLCLDMSQGYSTDVDSLLHNSDSFLSIVVVESCCYWTCVTFIIDIGFFCCPVGRPCRGSKVGMKITFPFWHAFSEIMIWLGSTVVYGYLLVQQLLWMPNVYMKWHGNERLSFFHHNQMLHLPFLTLSEVLCMTIFWTLVTVFLYVNISEQLCILKLPFSLIREGFVKKKKKRCKYIVDLHFFSAKCISVHIFITIAICVLTFFLLCDTCGCSWLFKTLASSIAYKYLRG